MTEQLSRARRVPAGRRSACGSARARALHPQLPLDARARLAHPRLREGWRRPCEIGRRPIRSSRFHHVNAFEDGGNIVVDLIAYRDAGIIDQLYLARLRAGDPIDATGQPHALCRCRSSGSGDVFAIAGRRRDDRAAAHRLRAVRGRALPLRVGRGAARPAATSSTASSRSTSRRGDADRGGASTAIRASRCSCPLPAAAAEGEGVLLSVVLDARRGALVPARARRADLAEIARAECPHHIPFGFHGNYFPARRERHDVATTCGCDVATRAADTRPTNEANRRAVETVFRRRHQPIREHDPMRTPSLCGVAALALALFAAPHRRRGARRRSPKTSSMRLNGVFGAHAGKRAAHAKGICVKGTFTPTAEAPSLTKAAALRRARARDRALLARRRQPDGAPTARRTTRAASRSTSISARATPPTSSMISAPVFARQDAGAVPRAAEDGRARSRRQAGCRQDRGLLQGESGEHAPGRLAQRAPVPASYATADYFGVHAFTAHQRQGREARHQVEVRAGEERAGLERRGGQSQRRRLLRRPS